MAIVIAGAMSGCDTMRGLVSDELPIRYLQRPSLGRLRDLAKMTGETGFRITVRNQDTEC